MPFENPIFNIGLIVGVLMYFFGMIRGLIDVFSSDNPTRVKVLLELFWPIVFVVSIACVLFSISVWMIGFTSKWDSIINGDY